MSERKWVKNRVSLLYLLLFGIPIITISGFLVIFIPLVSNRPDAEQFILMLFIAFLIIFFIFITIYGFIFKGKQLWAIYPEWYCVHEEGISISQHPDPALIKYSEIISIDKGSFNVILISIEGLNVKIKMNEDEIKHIEDVVAQST